MDTEQADQLPDLAEPSEGQTLEGAAVARPLAVCVKDSFPVSVVPGARSLNVPEHGKTRLGVFLVPVFRPKADA